MNKENIIEMLKSAESFENFTFEVDGTKCFVSRNIYPQSEFSMGVSGYSTTLYLAKNLIGVINAGGVECYTGNAPSIEQVAKQILHCFHRQKYFESII